MITEEMLCAAAARSCEIYVCNTYFNLIYCHSTFLYQKEKQEIITKRLANSTLPP